MDSRIQTKAEYWRRYRLEKLPYIKHICIICGTEFVTGKGGAKRCPDCRYLICQYCGEKFKSPQGNYKQKYCSRKCKDDVTKGIEPVGLRNHRGIKPRTYHITDRDKHGSAKDRDWRSAIFLRDNYTCRKCGMQGGRLQAHHIKSWKTHPELRWDIGNGETLCLACHRKTDTYGGNNSRKGELK